MGMDSSSSQHHHHQEMRSQTLESMLACTKPQQEKKPRPAEQALKCPRCDSANTKFCYYNNYSLSQPRYFCKSCRRYWTKGGTMRNVPVGGGCRKNKRSSSSSSSSSSSKRSQDQPMATLPSPNIPSLGNYDSSDLSLAIARLQKQTSGQLGSDSHGFSMWAHPSLPQDGGVLGFDALRSGGYLETPTSGLQNLYYGMGIGSGIGMGDCGMGMSGSQEMGIPYEELIGGGGGGPIGTTASTAVTTVKQENCGGRDDETRVLWGLPWQSVGGDGNVGEFDSSRQSWNGIGSSTWQGLLNSPLM